MGGIFEKKLKKLPETFNSGFDLLSL